jgi:hypothetical protein
MSKNLSLSAPQKKSRPTGRLEQSLKIRSRLQLGRDRFKPGIEAGTDARTDDHNRNARGDQAVFNRI